MIMKECLFQGFATLLFRNPYSYRAASKRAIAYRSAVRKFLGEMENTSQGLGDAYPWGNRFGMDLPPCPKGVRLGKPTVFLVLLRFSPKIHLLNSPAVAKNFCNHL